MIVLPPLSLLVQECQISFRSKWRPSHLNSFPRVSGPAELRNHPSVVDVATTMTMMAHADGWWSLLTSCLFYKLDTVNSLVIVDNYLCALQKLTDQINSILRERSVITLRKFGDSLHAKKKSHSNLFQTTLHNF